MSQTSGTAEARATPHLDEILDGDGILLPQSRLYTPAQLTHMLETLNRHVQSQTTLTVMDMDNQIRHSGIGNHPTDENVESWTVTIDPRHRKDINEALKTKWVEGCLKTAMEEGEQLPASLVTMDFKWLPKLIIPASDPHLALDHTQLFRTINAAHSLENFGEDIISKFGRFLRMKAMKDRHRALFLGVTKIICLGMGLMNDSAHDTHNERTCTKYAMVRQLRRAWKDVVDRDLEVLIECPYEQYSYNESAFQEALFGSNSAKINFRHLHILDLIQEIDCRSIVVTLYPRDIGSPTYQLLSEALPIAQQEYPLMILSEPFKGYTDEEYASQRLLLLSDNYHSISLSANPLSSDSTKLNMHLRVCLN